MVYARHEHHPKNDAKDDYARGEANESQDPYPASGRPDGDERKRHILRCAPTHEPLIHT